MSRTAWALTDQLAPKVGPPLLLATKQNQSVF